MFKLDNKTKVIMVMLFLMIGIAGVLFAYKTNESFASEDIIVKDIDLPNYQYSSLTSNLSNSIDSKEFHNETYQKIETEFIDFEVPIVSTHYWNNSGLDNFEMIIRNLSIKGYQDYIFKITWDDERYVKGTIEAHYEFVDGVLNKPRVTLHSVGDKDELNIRNVNVELGEIIGKKNKLERIERCIMNETNNDCQINVSYPIYLWSDFEDIDINEKISFTAIDPTSVTSCGTLSSDGVYTLDTDITDTGATCITISSSNVEFQGQGNTITSGTSTIAVRVTGTISNVTVRDLFIREGSTAFSVESSVSNSHFDNINISRTIFGSFKNAMIINGNVQNVSNIAISGFTGGSSTSLQIIGDDSRFTNGSLTAGVTGIDFGSNVDRVWVSGFNITGNTLRGIELGGAGSDNNIIFNNFFNNTLRNVFTTDGPGGAARNYYNTSLQARTSIVGGANVGGNFWAFPNGTGYSEICVEGVNSDICEDPAAANSSLRCVSCTGADNDIDAFPLIFVEAVAGDTCTCAGAGNNWEIDHADSCNIVDNCDLTTGELSFINSGTTTCDATIDTADLTSLATGTLQINDECIINIG